MTSARSVILFTLRCIVYMNVGIGGASATISVRKEVRMFDQIAITSASAKMLWRRCICCFPWKLSDVCRREQRLVPHHFVSYDPEVWKRMPYRYKGKIAVRGSIRRVAVKYAPCGWAVVHSWVSMVVTFRSTEGMASLLVFSTNSAPPAKLTCGLSTWLWYA